MVPSAIALDCSEATVYRQEIDGARTVAPDAERQAE